MHRAILTLTCVLATTSLGAQGSPPPGAGQWSPGNIPWQVESPNGTKWAVLEGDRNVAGETFTYAFLLPAGYWEHHWHASTARVAVIHGALRVAYGTSLDSTSARAYPIGSFLVVPANAQHTMGADVETIIIGTAVGPWATHRHDHNHDAELAAQREDVARGGAASSCAEPMA